LLIKDRAKWQYRIEAGRARFEHEVREAHQRHQQSILRFLRESDLLNVATAPIMYATILPIVLLDLWITT